MMIRLGMLILLAGCGSPASHSALKETSQLRRLVVVAMGGRNSCQKGMPYSPKSMSMYPDVQRAATQLSVHYGQTDVILSCFRGDGQLFYLESPESEVKVGEPQDLVSMLDGTQATVMLVGHSYGGWLAMQTLVRARLKAFLFTIDPISPVNCAFRRPQRWLGCTKAPTDIPYDVVAQKTFRWQNFFQRSTRYLHSSEIPQANANILLNGVGHTTIDNNEDIWRDFSANSDWFETAALSSEAPPIP